MSKIVLWITKPTIVPLQSTSGIVIYNRKESSWSITVRFHVHLQSKSFQEVQRVIVQLVSRQQSHFTQDTVMQDSSTTGPQPAGRSVLLFTPWPALVFHTIATTCALFYSACAAASATALLHRSHWAPDPPQPNQHPLQWQKLLWASGQLVLVAMVALPTMPPGV